MRVALIGRSQFLLDTAKKILKSGHKIKFIYTCKSEKYYKVNEFHFKNFCTSKKIPFFCDVDINKKINLLKKYKAEIGISVNYKTLIKKKTISIFKYGILNAHAGDLPKYKGNATPNWAILNFEKKIGLTIHSMNESLDSGKIIIKKFFKINEKTYINEIYDWMEKKIPFLFLESLKKIKNKNFFPLVQRGISLRTYPRKDKDGRINWQDKNRNILALIRATSFPFSGAFTFLKKKQKIRIFSAKKFIPKFKFYAVPGQVCLNNKNNPVISTVDGMIEILTCSKIKLEDKLIKKKILKSMRNRLF